MSATPPIGRNVAANGIRQHILHFPGPSTPLVIIPGITSPAATWGFVAERLATAFDTYVVDVRGRGLSSTGPELDYGLDAMADDLVGLIAALGLKDAAVLGHSMGARIVARAACRNPNGMARLLLIDPPVSGPGRRPYPAELPWYLDSIRLAQQGVDAEAMRPFCPTWTDEQLAARAEWLHTCFEPAIAAAYDGFHTDDIHQNLAALPVPAGLMLAGKGEVVTAEDEAEIAALNPDLRILRVPTAGHMIPWDDLEAFLAATADLLQVRIDARP